MFSGCDTCLNIRSNFRLLKIQFEQKQMPQYSAAKKDWQDIYLWTPDDDKSIHQYTDFTIIVFDNFFSFLQDSFHFPWFGRMDKVF